MMTAPLLAPLDRWEGMWAPYSQDTYLEVLGQIEPGDIVLEIGAGDLRLARQMAAQARWVYALEVNRALVNRARENLPTNCQVLTGDARALTFPDDVTVAVLLMRHCTHFAHYYDKLSGVSCRRLITNARWRMGVEVIMMDQLRVPYQQLELGWYACRCGKTGFKPGQAELVANETVDRVWELNSCPACHRAPEQEFTAQF